MIGQTNRDYYSINQATWERRFAWKLNFLKKANQIILEFINQTNEFPKQNLWQIGSRVNEL